MKSLRETIEAENLFEKVPEGPMKLRLMKAYHYGQQEALERIESAGHRTPELESKSNLQQGSKAPPRGTPEWDAWWKAFYQSTYVARAQDLARKEITRHKQNREAQ